MLDNKKLEKRFRALFEQYFMYTLIIVEFIIIVK